MALENIRIILEPMEDGDLGTTFEELQELKHDDIANNFSLICYDGYLLPAGAYMESDEKDECKTCFLECCEALINVEYDDIDSICYFVSTLVQLENYTDPKAFEIENSIDEDDYEYARSALWEKALKQRLEESYREKNPDGALKRTRIK